jgi:hypothetical protein
VKVWSFLLVFVGCGVTEEIPLRKTGPVTGSIQVPVGVNGDGWLFLREANAATASVPPFVTAVSRERLKSDSRFVFAAVPAREMKLSGILDVDGNFDGTIDVLSQPTAGDRTSDAKRISVQPGRGAEKDVSFDQLVLRDPPSFKLQSEEPDVTVDPTVNTVTSFVVVSDSIEKRYLNNGFDLHLVDADADGRPDDVNKDNIPDLSLQFVLLWKPNPGQNPSGERLLVPLVFDPTGILRELNGQLSQRVVVDRLQLAVLPQAQSIALDGTTRNAGQPPLGEYVLVALSDGGQFWQVPNGLLKNASQQVRFHVDRQ